MPSPRDVDKDLYDVLELASDAELEEIYSMLFGGWGSPTGVSTERKGCAVLLASRQRSSKVLLRS